MQLNVNVLRQDSEGNTLINLAALCLRTNVLEFFIDNPYEGLPVWQSLIGESICLGDIFQVQGNCSVKQRIVSQFRGELSLLTFWLALQGPLCARTLKWHFSPPWYETSV